MYRLERESSPSLTNTQTIPESVEVLTAEGGWTGSGVYRLERESSPFSHTNTQTIPESVEDDLTAEGGWTGSGVYRLERESSPTLTQIHKPYLGQLRLISLLREAGQGLVCIGWRESPPLLSHKYTNHTWVS